VHGVGLHITSPVSPATVDEPRVAVSGSYHSNSFSTELAYVLIPGAGLDGAADPSSLDAADASYIEVGVPIEDPLIGNFAFIATGLQPGENLIEMRLYAELQLVAMQRLVVIYTGDDDEVVPSEPLRVYLDGIPRDVDPDVPYTIRASSFSLAGEVVPAAPVDVLNVRIVRRRDDGEEVVFEDDIAHLVDEDGGFAVDGDGLQPSTGSYRVVFDGATTDDRPIEGRATIQLLPVDGSEASIEVLSPREGQQIGGDRFVLSGRLRTPAPIEVATYAIHGAEVDLDHEVVPNVGGAGLIHYFEVIVPYDGPLGDVDIDLFVRDELGHEATATVTFAIVEVRPAEVPVCVDAFRIGSAEFGTFGWTIDGAWSAVPYGALATWPLPRHIGMGEAYFLGGDAGVVARAPVQIPDGSASVALSAFTSASEPAEVSLVILDADARNLGRLTAQPDPSEPGALSLMTALPEDAVSLRVIVELAAGGVVDTVQVRFVDETGACVDSPRAIGPTVTGSLRHALAIDVTGVVHAWGDPFAGRLGFEADAYVGVPTPIDTHAEPWLAVSVASSDEHALAMTSDGEVVAWGRNDLGQAAPHLEDEIAPPTIVRLRDGAHLSRAMGIAASPGRTAVLRGGGGGEVWVWGDVPCATAAPGAPDDGAPLHLSALDRPMTSIALAGPDLFALDQEGALWRAPLAPLEVDETTCAPHRWTPWVDDPEGEDTGGDDPEGEELIPWYDALSAGHEHVLVLRPTGEVYAVGGNHVGQRGDGTFSNAPVDVLRSVRRASTMTKDGSGDSGCEEDDPECEDPPACEEDDPECEDPPACEEDDPECEDPPACEEDDPECEDPPACEEDDPECEDPPACEEDDPECEEAPIVEIGVPLSGIAAISAAGDRSVATTYDGALYVWGRNDERRQSSDTTSSPLALATPVDLDISVVAAFPILDHLLVVTSDGALVRVFGGRPLATVIDQVMAP